MKVYVSGSARSMGEDLPFLRKIVQVVNANHATVARNWIEAAYARKQQNVADEDIDWGSIYVENIDAITHADIAIIESTRNRFSQGFWVFSAVQRKRPTLIVSREKEHVDLYHFSSKYVTVKIYSTEDDLEKIVTDFIQVNTISNKDLRFNFFIDRYIYKYLRDKSYETGKNKSEIIRGLLEQEIKRRDNR